MLALRSRDHRENDLSDNNLRASLLELVPFCKIISLEGKDCLPVHCNVFSQLPWPLRYSIRHVRRNLVLVLPETDDSRTDVFLELAKWSKLDLMTRGKWSSFSVRNKRLIEILEFSSSKCTDQKLDREYIQRWSTRFTVKRNPTYSIFPSSLVPYQTNHRPSLRQLSGRLERQRPC